MHTLSERSMFCVFIQILYIKANDSHIRKAQLLYILYTIRSYLSSVFLKFM